jgi:hypothetical protein
MIFLKGNLAPAIQYIKIIFKLIRKLWEIIHIYLAY